MQFRRLLACLLLVFPAIAAAQTEPLRQPSANPREVSAPALAKPLATNRRSFFIPVTVDRASRDHVPAQVHLLVSADQGETWSTFAKQSPDSKGFQFQARDDGEYWFASRTLDAAGRARPAGDIEAELRIVVDSTGPKIELDAAVDKAGLLKAAWRISDPQVAPESVRVEYQSGDTLKPAWQSVPLDATAQKLAGEMLLGSADWSPSVTSRAVDVRIIVQDRAGNLATDTRRVFLPRDSRVATPRIPEWPPRVAPKPIEDSSPSIAGDPFTSRQIEEDKSLAPKSTVPSTTERSGTKAWPTDNKLPATPISQPLPQDKVAANPTSPAMLPVEPLDRALSEVFPPVGNRVVAQPSSTGGNSNPLIWPAETDRSAPPPAPDLTSPAPLGTITPPADVPSESAPVSDTPVDASKPQLTSSKSFALEYDVDSVGPAGVRAVELWVTVDDGRTWEKWGEDDDRRSPFEIQVQSERTFGFRMVIVSNNGLATRSPEPGDAPDIAVSIDVTQPRAKLLQAGYGQGEHSGQLDIRWEADDEHLGARPITISFSETPDGPFTTLAAGLPNSGQYHWTIDPRTPRQLYLRLEARDDAGNVATDQTNEPVSLEGLSPKGRIRAITPGPAAVQPPLQGAFRTPLFR